MTLRFSFPPPPSVNRTYRPRPADVREAKVWRDVAGWEMKEQGWSRPPPLTCDVLVKVCLPRTSDIDNRLKPILDLLQRMGVYENDRQVARLVVEFHTDRKVLVSVSALA